MYDKNLVTDKINTVNDSRILELQNQWYKQPQTIHTWNDYVSIAQHWFVDSKLVQLHGIEHFPYVDVTQGNTHYIESFIIKYG